MAKDRVEWGIEFNVDRMYDNAASTSVVAPQRAPTVSPSDPKYSGGSAATPQGINGILSATNSLSQSLQEGTDYGVMPFELLE